MGALSWFMKTPATKVLDNVAKGLDALVLTDEERIQYNSKATELWLQAMKDDHESGQIRAITRRVLAFLIAVPFVLLCLASAIVYPFDPEYAKHLLSLAESNFGYLTMGVAAFYFGPSMVGRIMKK